MEEEKMKKTLLASVASLSLVLAACGEEDAKTPAAGTPAEEETKKIALLMADLGNPFFHVLVESVEEQAAELGYEVEVFDGQNDASIQPGHVEDVIQKEFDAIIINPADEDSTANALQEAIDKGIPVVTVDRQVQGVEGILSYLVTDNLKGGELAGEWLAAALPEGGNVIHMEGVIGTAPQRERGGGFLSVIDPAQNPDSKFTILDTVVGDFSMAPAELAMTDMLTKHADIDAVFSQNDTMAVGIAQAIENAGRQDDGIIIIGFDGAKEALDLIEEGKMATTAVQDFVFIGKEAVNFVDAFLKDGTKPEPHVLVDVYMAETK